MSRKLRSNRGRDHEVNTSVAKALREIKRTTEAPHSTFILNDQNRNILNPESICLLAWNYLMSIVILSLAAVIPFEAAFAPVSDSIGISTLYIVTDICAGIDILVSFRTPYRKADGLYEYNLTKIAKKYCLSWFIFDLLSILPMNILVSEAEDTSTKGALVTMYLRRLPKLFRVQRVFRYMCSSMKYFSLIYLVTVSILILHWVTCLVVGVLGVCLPDNLSFYRTCQKSVNKTYWNGLLFSLSLLLNKSECVKYATLPDKVFVNNPYINTTYFESIMVSINILGWIIGSSFIGTIVHITQLRNTQGREYEDTLDKVRAELSSTNISEDLYNSVLGYYDLLWKQNARLSPSMLLNDENLPHSLRGKLAFHFYAKYLIQCDFVGSVSYPLLCRICLALQCRWFVAGDYIITSGDIGDEMFILCQGCCAVYIGGCINDAANITNLLETQPRPKTLFNRMAKKIKTNRAERLAKKRLGKTKILTNELPFDLTLTSQTDQYNSKYNDIHKHRKPVFLKNSKCSKNIYNIDVVENWDLPLQARYSTITSDKNRESNDHNKDEQKEYEQDIKKIILNTDYSNSKIEQVADLQEITLDDKTNTQTVLKENKQLEVISKPLLMVSEKYLSSDSDSLNNSSNEIDKINYRSCNTPSQNTLTVCEEKIINSGNEQTSLDSVESLKNDERLDSTESSEEINSLYQIIDEDCSSFESIVKGSMENINEESNKVQEIHSHQIGNISINNQINQELEELDPEKTEVLDNSNEDENNNFSDLAGDEYISEKTEVLDNSNEDENNNFGDLAGDEYSSEKTKVLNNSNDDENNNFGDLAGDEYSSEKTKVLNNSNDDENNNFSDLAGDEYSSEKTEVLDNSNEDENNNFGDLAGDEYSSEKTEVLDKSKDIHKIDKISLSNITELNQQLNFDDSFIDGVIYNSKEKYNEIKNAVSLETPRIITEIKDRMFLPQSDQHFTKISSKNITSKSRQSKTHNIGKKTKNSNTKEKKSKTLTKKNTILTEINKTNTYQPEPGDRDKSFNHRCFADSVKLNKTENQIISDIPISYTKYEPNCTKLQEMKKDIFSTSIESQTKTCNSISEDNMTKNNTAFCLNLKNDIEINSVSDNSFSDIELNSSASVVTDDSEPYNSPLNIDPNEKGKKIDDEESSGSDYEGKNISDMFSNSETSGYQIISSTKTTGVTTDVVDNNSVPIIIRKSRNYDGSIMYPKKSNSNSAVGDLFLSSRFRSKNTRQRTNVSQNMIKSNIQFQRPLPQLPHAYLSPPCHFGEIALIKPSLRTATVKAICTVNVLTLHRNIFKMLRNCPCYSSILQDIEKQSKIVRANNSVTKSKRTLSNVTNRKYLNRSSV